MRALAVAFLAAAVLPVLPAHALDPGGVACTAVPTAGAAVVQAGPLTLTNGTAPASGRVTCTVQGPAAPRHADADLGAATSATAFAVAVLPPTTVPAAAPPSYVCTRVDVDGGPTLYYDSPHGAWSTSATVGCAVVRDAACINLCDPATERACPVLARAVPPYGDVPGVVDCPSRVPGAPMIGEECGWAGVTDPTSPDEDPFEVYGGPVVSGDTRTVTLTCTLQAGYRHLDPDGASASQSGTGGALLLPVLVSMPRDAAAYVCTQVRVGADPPLYWDDQAGAWSTDAGAWCAQVDRGGEPCGCDPWLDDAICPVLAEPFPPEGDVVLPPPVGAIWDCPPYGNVGPGQP